LTSEQKIKMLRWPLTEIS